MSARTLPAADAPEDLLAPGEKDLLDRALADLAEGARAWTALPLPARARLLTETHRAIAAHAERWVRTALDIKGIDPGSPLVGEEWMSGPYPALTAAGTLAGSVSALARGRSPLDGITLRGDAEGRTRIPVLPHGAGEALLLHGFSGEVWTRPGVDARTARAQAGLGQRRPGVSGGVGLVLGAGNITSIPPLDVLSELIAHNRVTILKLNPVMAPMMSVYLAALGPLVRARLLRIVQGGAQTGAYLAHHPAVSNVHITGSAATHDAIVWGTGAEALRRRAENDPLLRTPITSELGGVSPTIIVPGRWSRRDLRYQAEHVATQRLHNSGHNCIASQLVVLSRDWPQREEFLAELRSALSRAHQRPAWYPGTAQRMENAAEAYPGAERLSGAQQDRLLIMLGPDDDPTAFCATEYFAPVLGVIELPGSAERFLDSAVAFANDRLLGTLGANIIIAPRQLRALGARFEEAVAELRYGTIAVNTWTALGFLTAAASWGAFPGHTIDDVQSGIGQVHNALLIDAVERTVVRGPFRPFPRSFAGGEPALFPRPPWFVTVRSAGVTGRRLTRYAAKPSALRMAAVFASAFRP